MVTPVSLHKCFKNILRIKQNAVPALCMAIIGLVISCSSSGEKRSIDDIVVAPSDSAAYKKGEEDARRLLELSGNRDALNDGLLEIRSRETYLHDHIRRESAEAYVKGFQDYVTSHDESLAKTLF